MARACYEAALRVDPEIILVTLAATPLEAVARELGASYANEIFADRAYNDDATLVDRSKPGAVLHDPAVAAKRMEDMIRAGGIITESGKIIPCRIDTICVHGDNPEAVAMARAVRDHLTGAGIAVARFKGETA